MRASIVLWSALSGVVLGVFVDAVVIGVAVLIAALAPAFADRSAYRWAAGAILGLIPVTFALLGALEGHLKAG